MKLGQGVFKPVFVLDLENKNSQMAFTSGFMKIKFCNILHLGDQKFCNVLDLGR